MFCKNHGFIERKLKKQAHLFPKKSYDLVVNYLKGIYEIRKNCINDIALIINMDETPIFFTP